jgi:hypothetical protein
MSNHIKQRGLGRDLEALLGKRRVSETAPALSIETNDATLPAANQVAPLVEAAVDKNNELRQLPIEQSTTSRFFT